MASSLLQKHLDQANNELTQQFVLLSQLYEQKQWHQLTNLLETIALPPSQANLPDLYQDFVSKFEQKLNPMRLCEFCIQASEQFLVSRTSQELLLAIAFMQRLVFKSSPEASFVCKMRVVDLEIQLGKLEQAESTLTEWKPKLALLQGSAMETTVKASFYMAESNLLRRTGPPGLFFRSAMNYLEQKPKNIPNATLLAVDVAVAALVAEDVFNFGEILHYDLVKQELKNEYKWLFDLLMVFNQGGQALLFQEIAQQPAFSQSPTLVASMDVLKRKLVLLTLVNFVFQRENQQRDVSFEEICEHCGVAMDQVEWVCMQAFSRKLLRGTMDGCRQMVSIRWVMPRVLDEDHMRVLGEKLMGWTSHVEEALVYESLVPEVFLQ